MACGVLESFVMPVGACGAPAMGCGMWGTVICGYRRLLGMSGGVADISYMYRTLYISAHIRDFAWDIIDLKRGYCTCHRNYHVTTVSP
jgi:hypothetical protein